MTSSRLGELRRWLSLCSEGMPQTEWMCVVGELIVAVEQFQQQVQALAAGTRPEDVLDCVQVAKMLQVAPRTVMKWRDDGRLKCSRESVTNDRIILRQDVLDFAQEHGFVVLAN